jgi:hypothetical protein
MFDIARLICILRLERFVRTVDCVAVKQQCLSLLCTWRCLFNVTNQHWHGQESGVGFRHKGRTFYFATTVHIVFAWGCLGCVCNI